MNMNIIDIVLTIIVNIIECFVLIYYTNSVMNYRHSRSESNICITIGYAVYCCLCFFNQPLLNILGFVAVNFFILYIGFSENSGSIIIKVIIITVFMMFTELAATFLVDTNISREYHNYFDVSQDLLFTFVSKTLYFIFVVMLKHYTVSRNSDYKSYETFWLLPLPIFTCAFFLLFNHIRKDLNFETDIAFMALCFILIIANFVVYLVCDRIIDKNIQIKRLTEIENKNKTDFESYQLIKDKYDELKIMVHDFNKYCANIEAVLNKDQTEALSLIHKIENKNKEFLLVEYTNNKALNILLSQKMKECNTEDIDLQIYIQNIDISFISEKDIVSIFANLLDNAIDSCKLSENKKIFLSIYDMNNAFVVIKVDNSSDVEPMVEDGKLRTQKKDRTGHGIGMISIKQALKKYDGKIKWSFNADKRVFNTTIIINYPTIEEKK